MKESRIIAVSWVIALVCFVSAARADEDGKSKVLLIGKKPDHPWGTHMYLHTCEVLARCLRLTEDVDTVVSELWPDDPEALQGVKTIVLYTDPGAELLLTGRHAAEFERLMQKGVGLVTIHWASSIHKKNLERLGKRWKKYLGGTWVSNVGLSTDKSRLKQVLPDHPVCRGWSEYELHDEFYLNPTIAGARPLLQVETRSKSVVVGWVHERKNSGRAFGTTLGHFYRNFQDARFRRMIVNGILWTAHVRVPEEGAPVDLKSDDLALPARPESDETEKN